MMKFETPVVEVLTFAVEDVITTSEVGGGGIGGDNEMPEI